MLKNDNKVENMKKCIKNKHKFVNYANHLNSLYDSNKSSPSHHTMLVDGFESVCRSFYNIYPTFGVMESNDIMSAMNNDYQMYVDWMIDE